MGLPRSDLGRGPATSVCPRLPSWHLGSARDGAVSSGAQSRGGSRVPLPFCTVSFPRSQTTCGSLLLPLRSSSHPRVLPSIVGVA